MQIKFRTLACPLLAAIAGAMLLTLIAGAEAQQGGQMTKEVRARRNASQQAARADGAR
jgi:hypothetical protein